MTYGAWEVVGQKDQELRFGKTIGDAFRDLITKRFAHNAAKKIETLWRLDPKTAKNVVQRGCVSERTLTKAALTERWALWMALGEELFGQSYAEWEEQRLTKIMEDAARDLDRVRRLRPLDQALLERSIAPLAARDVDDGEGAQFADGREGFGRVRASRGRASGAPR
ncbi:MAG: hypothetical protein JWQ97_967 [Phenylobacterium sp.]|nr:hypothetical protein [Phenylobacterium sp.]